VVGLDRRQPLVVLRFRHQPPRQEARPEIENDLVQRDFIVHIEQFAVKVRVLPDGASASENKDRPVFRRVPGYFPGDGYVLVPVKDYLHAMGGAESDKFRRIRQTVQMFIGETDVFTQGCTKSLHVESSHLGIDSAELQGMMMQQGDQHGIGVSAGERIQAFLDGPELLPRDFPPCHPAAIRGIPAEYPDRMIRDPFDPGVERGNQG